MGKKHPDDIRFEQEVAQMRAMDPPTPWPKKVEKPPRAVGTTENTDKEGA